METRYERGLRRLNEVDGDQIDGVVAGLRDVAPDFARYLVEFAFGDIHARPGLDLKTRQLATVAALTALGTAATQLKVHIAGALNVGCTREEIAEVIMQMAIYAGFPAALNGLAAAKEVFAARAATAEGRPGWLARAGRGLNPGEDPSRRAGPAGSGAAAPAAPPPGAAPPRRARYPSSRWRGP